MKTMFNVHVLQLAREYNSVFTNIFNIFLTYTEIYYYYSQIWLKRLFAAAIETLMKETTILYRK